MESTLKSGITVDNDPIEKTNSGINKLRNLIKELQNKLPDHFQEMRRRLLNDIKLQTHNIIHQEFQDLRHEIQELKQALIVRRQSAY